MERAASLIEDASLPERDRVADDLDQSAAEAVFQFLEELGIETGLWHRVFSEKPPDLSVGMDRSSLDREKA
jgi:hypothetical protein